MSSTHLPIAHRLNSKQFAIVVLTYNHPEISLHCLESILNVNSTTTIYVVHNGSDSKNIKLLTAKFPMAEHIILEKNKGFTGGANTGLRAAFNQFDHVLFLTNDTELLGLPKIPPMGFCSVTIRKRNTDYIDSILGAIDLRQGKLRHIKTDSDISSLNINTKYIPGTAFWIDRKTFELLQGFDETYHTYWEDVDFSYRAYLNNIPLSYSKDTLIKHRIGKTCHKDSYYTYYLFQRNRKKFMLKHGLHNFSFWFVFLYDITKYCKYRFRHLWRIVYD